MSLISLLGIINLVLVLFQLATGLQLLTVSFRLHRTTGQILAVTAVAHGVLAFIATM